MLDAKRSVIMPWYEVNTMSLRHDFCAVASAEGANVSELCRRFGISRKTGYKWLHRYQGGGAAELADRSRCPTTMPRLTDGERTAQVVAVRDAHPTWGGRKLRRWLQDQGADPPAASTITELLRRADRLAGAGHPPPHAYQRFEAPAPNHLWQLDFKGHFAMAVGRCHPLHVLDDHSRVVLGLVACADEQRETVQRELTTIFRQYGLPWRLLCDNGPPWGTVHGEQGLTALGAWLIRLGIRLTHGRPYHPQTQGKLERANRTMAADVLAIPRYPDLAACQRAFDAWRTCYNHERPHEALGLDTPMRHYAMSPRPFPETLPPLAYEAGDVVRLVRRNGVVSFHRHDVNTSSALAGQWIAFRPTTIDGVWEIRYAHQVVRRVDLRGPTAASIDPVDPADH
jgi:transposase InsO family protein